MSKANNLTDFLTDVAGAIRSKKGYPSTQKINPQNFASEIASIQSGGITGYEFMSNFNPNSGALHFTVSGESTFQILVEYGMNGIQRNDSFYVSNESSYLILPDNFAVFTCCFHVSSGTIDGPYWEIEIDDDYGNGIYLSSDDDEALEFINNGGIKQILIVSKKMYIF